MPSNTDMKNCQTGKGMLNRLDNLVFCKGSVQILKCKKCDNTVMVSDWYNGESFKKLLEMNPECEECHARFI